MAKEKINWTEFIKSFGEDVSEEALNVFKENKDFFAQLSRDELLYLLHHVAGSGEAELNQEVYSMMLRQLTDEQFLALREQSVEAMKAWNELDKRKKKVVTDLVSRVGQMTANILIKQLLLVAL